MTGPCVQHPEQTIRKGKRTEQASLTLKRFCEENENTSLHIILSIFDRRIEPRTYKEFYQPHNKNVKGQIKILAKLHPSPRTSKWSISTWNCVQHYQSLESVN